MLKINIILLVFTRLFLKIIRELKHMFFLVADGNQN